MGLCSCMCRIPKEILTVAEPKTKQAAASKAKKAKCMSFDKAAAMHSVWIDQL